MGSSQNEPNLIIGIDVWGPAARRSIHRMWMTRSIPCTSRTSTAWPRARSTRNTNLATKASVAMTQTHGIIVAAIGHEKNLYDAHALPEVLDQAEAIADTRAARAIVDRGYRGRKCVDGTEILVPGRAPRGQSRAKNAAMRKRFRRRAAIEPLLSHSSMTFGSCAACSKASEAINSTSCWPRRHGTSANGCGWSSFFGFASSARSHPKTSASRYRESPENF